MSAFDLVRGAIVLEAKDSKHGEKDLLPIYPSLKERLRRWLAGRPARSLCWPGDWAARSHGADMMRHDLAVAGIPYADEAGEVADFHALRTSFISNLARANVPLVLAQKLARHSTPVLTSNVYSKIQPSELSEAVASLPWLEPSVEPGGCSPVP